MTLKALPWGSRQGRLSLQKVNKLQRVLQHERDQLGKGTLPRDVWGRSSEEKQIKQRVQMLGGRMWLGGREEVTNNELSRWQQAPSAPQALNADILHSFVPRELQPAGI